MARASIVTKLVGYKAILPKPAKLFEDENVPKHEGEVGEIVSVYLREGYMVADVRYDDGQVESYNMTTAVFARLLVAETDDEVREAYRKYRIEALETVRAFWSTATKRGESEEHSKHASEKLVEIDAELRELRKGLPF